MCDQDVEYSPPSRRKRSTMKNNGSSEREKLRSLSLSLNNEMGGHRLRSRTHVDYTLNSPTEEEFPEKVDSPLKESKDLRRSSTRLSLVSVVETVTIQFLVEPVKLGIKVVESCD